MKPRISMMIFLDTEAHAQAVRNSIENRLSLRNVFRLENLLIEHNGSNWVLSADVRFNTIVDRDDVKDWIKDQIQNHPTVKSWILGAEVTAHLCHHDEENPGDCRMRSFDVWRRQ